MYKVLCDGAPIYDPRHEDLVLIDPKLTLELNTAGSFTCKIPPGHPQYDKPQEITSRITVYQDDTILFQGRITSVSLDFYNRKTITCEGELAYLNDTIQRPAEYHDMTVRRYLEKIIELHNAQVDESRQFTVGIVTVTNSTDNVYRYTNWETSMQTIKEDLVDDLGGYVRVRYENGKRYIDYITDYGVISKQVIAFGENLLDFTRSVDLTDIATVCIPLGARQSESPIKALEARLTISSINDNKDYVESADAVKRYGRIVKTVTWDDVTTPERLKTHGEKWLEDEQFDAMTLECKAIDLHYVDSSQEALHLGDSVRIVSKPHGLDKYFPVTKLTISLNQLQNNTITFNGQIEQKRTLTARTGSTSEKLKNLIEVTPNKNEMVSEAIAEATALITAHTHGYVTTSDDSSELLVSDTPDYRNATNIWRWNLNGLGHSSTGYSGTYTTALTMDGWIVGSRVAAGSIGASQLSIDYKNTVTEEITEKSDAAKLAANTYTDEQKAALQTAIDGASKVANSATDLAKAAQKTADGKITTYYQTDAPSSGMTSGDLWIDTDDGNKLYRYSGTEWTAIQDKAISDAMTAAGTAQATADGKVVTYAQASAPASTGLTLGDLWIDTDDNNHMYRWDGAKWAEIRDGYIEEAKNAAESYTDTKLKEYSTSAEIKVMTDSISTEVAKKTDSATIISTINQSAETVSINASKIALEGLVTANKNFQIDTDGNMTAVNGKFSGIITGATMQVADSSGTSQTAITSDGKIKSVDSNKTFWLDMQNGAFELGPIKSIGTNNQDLLISRMLNVEYGVEIWRQNKNGEPYIDFHCEADSPSATSKYDYAARLSCQKAGYFQMLGVDKGDGNGHVHARLEVGGLELYTSKSSASSTTAGIPYIDFHLEDTAADYSMRIAAETTDSCVIRSEGGYAAIINTKAATISSASSKRVKRNIENITDADAEKLLDLRPVSFEYVYAPGETYHGLIAEEVQKVLPELVVIPKDYNPDDDTDMLHIPRLCYTDFIPYLIRLCQIQQKEIDALKGETA